MQANFVSLNYNGNNEFDSSVMGSDAIFVKHGNETLEFSSSVYQAELKNCGYEPFDQLNRYWKYMPQGEQDKLFDLLREAREVLNTPDGVMGLIKRLRPIIYEIVDIHDSPAFTRWVPMHSGVWIPEDFQSQYISDPTKPGSREQTYTVGDYWQLVTMILKTRVLVPLFGEFYDITKKESGPIFRDINAYYLISKCSIHDSDAMERLRVYVAKNIKQTGIDVRSSINGIGSELYQQNLIAGIVIRSLAVGRLTRGDRDAHLVQAAYHALRNKLSQGENHQNAVLPKDNPGEGDDGNEDSSSRAEKYKNKAPIPPGEITAIEKYTEYTHEIAARLLLKGELDEAESKELDFILETTPDIEFEECQIQLMRWVINPIVSARAFWDINKSSVMRLAAIAQFVLWKTDFRDLAILVTARSLTAQGYGTFSGESRTQIPKALADRINELYPYYRQHPKKVSKTDNNAIREIMQLADDLCKHTWFLNIADDHIEKLRGSATNKTYRPPGDMRVRLATYVIYMQERNANFIPLYKF